MKTNLEIDAEAPRSQWQPDSTAKTQPTKTVTTVANDQANEREQLLGDAINDLLDEVDIMYGALQEVRCNRNTGITSAFCSLRRMEHILWSDLMEGLSHE